jgi:hypothetical protein
MSYRIGSLRSLSRGLTLLLGAALAACGGGEQKQAAAPAAGTAETAQPADTTAPAPLQASGATWTPEQLEELAAPVALFPDPVLAQVLLASTNPQEVLDAGNWLLQNQALEGKALDDAATAVGFTPPTRALIQFPQVIDMMCLEMGWTTNLGQAFVDDQDGLLGAVQRLRLQAREVGNLQSSDQMKVETATQDGEEVVLLSPPSPEVVYVPQYDPVAAYAPAPASTAAAPATTTTTTTEKGYSGGEMVATGLLAFGAGLLVAEVFDDDDDDWYHHHDYYGYGGMPYYPPYPYRPVYGGGYYPSHGYNRPPNYGGNWGNNNTIIINKNNNYWNRYDNDRVTTTRSRAASSPITTAKKNRPELQALNAEAKKGPKRTAPATPEAWKGQGGYAGAGGKDTPSRVASAKPGAPTRDATKTAPKVQGAYAGARDRAKPAATPTAKPYNAPSAKPAAARPATAGARDRGYTAPAAKPVAKPGAKPTQMPATRPAAKPTAVSGANRQGTSAKAASQRGKQSMPKGVPQKARSGGGTQKAGR